MAHSEAWTKSCLSFCGRKIQEKIITKDGAKIINFEYDALGFLFKTQRIAEDQTITEYTIRDILGRVLEERKEDSSNNIFGSTRYEYDSYGNKHIISQGDIINIYNDIYNFEPIEIDSLIRWLKRNKLAGKNTSVSGNKAGFRYRSSDTVLIPEK